MNLHDLGQNTLALSVISLIAGALITTITQKIASKTVRLRYSTNIWRVGTASDDPIFGAARVTWQNNPVRNLYTAELEIENSSNRDFENVDLKAYAGNDTFLLSERSSVEGTPYIVPWSQEFKDRMAVAPDAVPTQAQWDFYYHQRDYQLKVFNRGQLIRITYLCTRPNDDRPPEIFVSTLLKGARLIYQQRQALYYGVPSPVALLRGLMMSALAVVGCALFVRRVWLAAVLSLVVGLAVLPIGAATYKLERWLRNKIAG